MYIYTVYIYKYHTSLSGSGGKLAPFSAENGARMVSSWALGDCRIRIQEHRKRGVGGVGGVGVRTV